MIGSLRGKVLFKEGSRLIIDVSGVGYRVLASQKVLAKSKVGDQIFLYIYTHVKEEALELLGFEEPEDLRLFENLLTVAGIGPKTAMSVFSFSDRDGIVNAVLKGDVDFFTAVPRLGHYNRA
ncbi:MAG: Holliday junction ATP-dependent DNA helicase RuvA [Candidatus Levybacteria bacterium GW2011_GWA2_40_8]|nr:MAG: Holliday junction ATP-dependent DNA helicase RuvA [Candidatus Levybacteria bacterium GW2011_GWA2_40_8]